MDAPLNLLVLVENEQVLRRTRRIFTEAGVRNVCYQAASPAEILAAANGALAMRRDTKRQGWLTDLARDYQQLATIGAVTSGMSHDFSNSLTAITGSVSLLAGRFPNDPLAERALRMIQEASQQATHLARSLMCAEQRLPAAPAPFDLNLLAEEAAASPAAQANTRFNVRVDPESAEPNGVNADRNQVWLAFVGLIAAVTENATSGGSLRIKVEHPEPQTDARAPAYATARFTSPTPWIETDGASSPRAAYLHAPAVEHAGLSLPFLVRLIRRQGGAMRLGAGTEDDPLSLTLPASTATRSRSAPHSVAPGKIALLTHREYYGLLLGAGLETVGFHVRRTTRADDLLRVLSHRPAECDLLVLEVEKPHVDGMSCLRELRSRGIALPAILLVGSADHALADSPPAGITVMRKPVNLADLADACRAVWRGASDSEG